MFEKMMRRYICYIQFLGTDVCDFFFRRLLFIVFSGGFDKSSTDLHSLGGREKARRKVFFSPKHGMQV
jgi:hypothetical protein